MELTMNTLINLDDVTTDYTYLDQEETDDVINHVSKHILEVNKKPGQNNWNEAWSDVAKCDSPRYFKPRFTIDNQGVYRYNQKYIKSPCENLESKFHDKLISNIQDRWLQDIDCVVEFGCGTGHNLQKIRSRNENIKVFGSDWANSSQEILTKNNIPTWNFDMTKFNSKLPYNIKDFNNICFLTVGSMEQLGTRWHNFLHFMLSFKPAKSIHIEPIVELYDSNNQIDKLAIDYHYKREYLNGFYSCISRLDELKYQERTTFGNTYNEGFTILELEYA
jgi:hypothetical protein